MAVASGAQREGDSFGEVRPVRSLLPEPRSDESTVVPNNVVPLRAADRVYVPAQQTASASASTANRSGWRSELAMIVVGVLVVSGFVVMAIGTVQAGVVVLAAATAVAFSIRAVCSEQAVGALKVRSKVLDVLLLGGMTGALVYLALTLQVG